MDSTNNDDDDIFEMADYYNADVNMDDDTDVADELVEVEVEFDYEAESQAESGMESEFGKELTIKTGDIVKEVKRMEGGWWEGFLNGRRGIFPNNFVKVRLIKKMTCFFIPSVVLVIRSYRH